MFLLNYVHKLNAKICVDSRTSNPVSHSKGIGNKLSVLQLPVTFTTFNRPNWTDLKKKGSYVSLTYFLLCVFVGVIVFFFFF